MENRNYINSVTVEGNIIFEPDFSFDKNEELDVCKIIIANNYYPNENERECNYFNIYIYSKKLIEKMKNIFDCRGKRVIVKGRMRQIVQDRESTRVITVAKNIKFCE